MTRTLNVVMDALTSARLRLAGIATTTVHAHLALRSVAMASTSVTTSVTMVTTRTMMDAQANARLKADTLARVEALLALISAHQHSRLALLATARPLLSSSLTLALIPVPSPLKRSLLSRRAVSTLIRLLRRPIATLRGSSVSYASKETTRDGSECRPTHSLTTATGLTTLSKRTISTLKSTSTPPMETSYLFPSRLRALLTLSCAHTTSQ